MRDAGSGRRVRGRDARGRRRAGHRQDAHWGDDSGSGRPMRCASRTSTSTTTSVCWSSPPAVARRGCEHFIVHARKAVLGGLSPKENREVPPLRLRRRAAAEAGISGAVDRLNGGLRTVEQSHRGAALVRRGHAGPRGLPPSRCWRAASSRCSMTAGTVPDAASIARAHGRLRRAGSGRR